MEFSQPSSWWSQVLASTHPASMLERCVLPNPCRSKWRMAQLPQVWVCHRLRSILAVPAPFSLCGSIHQTVILARLARTGCADRIRSCFRQPQQLVPHDLWNGVPISFHLARVAVLPMFLLTNRFVPEYEFDTVFAVAISDEFRAYCADQAWRVQRFFHSV